MLKHLSFVYKTKITKPVLSVHTPRINKTYKTEPHLNKFLPELYLVNFNVSELKQMFPGSALTTMVEEKLYCSVNILLGKQDRGKEM